MFFNAVCSFCFKKFLKEDKMVFTNLFVLGSRKIKKLIGWLSDNLDYFDGN